MHGQNPPCPAYIDYGRSNFEKMTKAYQRFVETVPFAEFQKPDRTESPYGVVVAARNNSGIPFFSLTIAILYAHKHKPVTIIWDDLPFLEPEFDSQNEVLAQFIKHIAPRIHARIIRLSTMRPTVLKDTEHPVIEKLAKINAIWNVRNITPNRALTQYEKLSRQCMLQNAPRIKTLYRENRFAHCIHQSVYNNNGGLHRIFANQNQILCFSLDMANGQGGIARNSAPAHRKVTPELIDPASPFYLFEDHRDRIHAIVWSQNEFNRRRYALNKKYAQVVSCDYAQHTENKYDVLMPLNMFWDVASLGVERIFPSPFEWLDQTIEHILDNTQASVAVKQHPRERQFERFKTGSRLGSTLETKYGKNPRFKFFAAADPVNTYSLMENSRLVLPYSSTLGMEAALMNKKVLTCTDVYYAGQSFVENAATKAEYFEKINRLCTTSDPAIITPAQRQSAWLLYFVNFFCYSIQSDFGLNPADFKVWTAKGFQGLLENNNLMMAIDSTFKKEPYVYRNGRRVLKQIADQIETAGRTGKHEPSTAGQARIVEQVSTGQYRQVLEFLGVEHTPDSAHKLYARAFVLANLNRRQEAILNLQQLLDIDPKHVRAAWLLEEMLKGDSPVEYQPNRLNVIGILCPSYSGSTLLTSILDCHSDIFGAGEIRWIFEKKPHELDHLVNVAAEMCSKTGLEWKNPLFSHATYENIYSLIARIFKKHFIVDASKEIQHFSRILACANPKLCYTFGILTKHPLRLIASHFMHRWKKNPEWQKKGRAYAINYLVEDLCHKFESIAEFVTNNQSQHRFIYIKYEDMVENLPAALQPLLHGLGLEFQQDMRSFDRVPHAFLGGNIGPRYAILKTVHGVEERISNPIQRKFYNQTEGIRMDNNFRRLFTSRELHALVKNENYNWLIENLHYANNREKQNAHNTACY